MVSHNHSFYVDSHKWNRFQAPASDQPAPVVQAASVVEAITAVEEENNSLEDCLGEDKEDVDKEECKDDDDEYEDDDEEEEQEEVVGGRSAPPNAAAASSIVPAVGNHIQQRNHMNANFEGFSSCLAPLYELLLGTFSKWFLVFWVRFLWIQIERIQII